MGTSVNNKCKAFTSLEQSKKLAEILPIESADMWWSWFSDPFDYINGGEYATEPLLHKPVCNPKKIIPCWSLAALLDILPETIEDKYGEYELNIDMIYKRPEYVRLCDCNHCDFPSWDWDNKELLDNIVEAVIWLNNNGYLRNEKLY